VPLEKMALPSPIRSGHRPTDRRWPKTQLTCVFVLVDYLAQRAHRHRL